MLKFKNCKVEIEKNKAWRRRPVLVHKLCPHTPLSDKQLQPTTLEGYAPYEVAQHKYFSFLMDGGRLLLFVVVIVFSE